jgi:hypothetical protein
VCDDVNVLYKGSVKSSQLKKLSKLITSAQFDMEMIVVKVRLVDWKNGKCGNTILPFQHGGSCASPPFFLGQIFEKRKSAKNL